MALVYHDRQRKNAKVRSVTLQASVTKTATFTSAATEIGDASTLRLNLAVTAHSGTTPTLDVTVTTSPTSGGTYVAVSPSAFTQVTTTDGTTRKIFTGLDRFVKVTATIGGTTPSYTYSVTGEAV